MVTTLINQRLLKQMLISFGVLCALSLTDSQSGLVVKADQVFSVRHMNSD